MSSSSLRSGFNAVAYASSNGTKRKLARSQQRKVRRLETFEDTNVG